MKEIERKFLLRPGIKIPIGAEERQTQGYFPTKKGLTARVRVSFSDTPSQKDIPRCYLTFKGPTKGISRMEIETAIPSSLAADLMHLCDRQVNKTRRYIHYKGHRWEIDFFQGTNKGLVVAEVELRSEKEEVELPPWIGKEVTGIKKYSCSNLAKRPFKSW